MKYSSTSSAVVAEKDTALPLRTSVTPSTLSLAIVSELENLTW